MAKFVSCVADTETIAKISLRDYRHRLVLMRLRDLYYRFSPTQRLQLRRLVYSPIDLWEGITGQRPPLRPPRGMIFTGGGDYMQKGEEYKQYFIQYGGLLPHHQVLDIGSGIGRMAVPLTTYLDQRGGYEGFDIVPQGVTWCKKHISSRFPHFQFTLVDLENDLYTSHGQAAAQFTFPYSSDRFDFAFLTSVFTHMQPPEVARYLHEISRVLQLGGKCLATFFLLDETSTALMQQHTGFTFPHPYEGYRLLDDRVKNANIAYERGWLEKVLAEANLTLDQHLPGFWCGRPKSESYDFQDMLILQKRNK